MGKFALLMYTSEFRLRVLSFGLYRKREVESPRRTGHLSTPTLYRLSIDVLSFSVPGGGLAHDNRGDLFTPSVWSFCAVVVVVGVGTSFI